MDREKQIEELASLLTQYEYKLCKRLPKNKCLLTSKTHAQVCCDYCKIAEFLINLGYCKITDNEVVISKAEYNELWDNGFDRGKEFAEKFYKPLVKAETHEETASEILKDLLNEATSNISDTVELTTFQILNLAKKYGVLY